MSKTLMSAAVAALCSPEALAMLQASPDVADRAAELGLRNRNGRIFEADVIEARAGGQAKGGAAAPARKAASQGKGGSAGRAGARKR